MIFNLIRGRKTQLIRAARFLLNYVIYEEGNDKRIAKMQDKIRNASKRSVTFLTLMACKSEDQLEFKHPNILALFGKRENTFITTNFVNTKILKMVSHNTKYRFCTS